MNDLLLVQGFTLVSSCSNWLPKMKEEEEDLKCDTCAVCFPKLGYKPLNNYNDVLYSGASMNVR